MIIGLTGASGFIGREFRKLAEAEGHTVVAYSLSPKESGCPSPSTLDFTGIEALVHLAGANVLRLWTSKSKALIRDSRVALTQQLVAALRAQAQPPRVLVSASGAGYFGDRGDELLDEVSPKGSGFLADVVEDWEAAVASAQDFTRTVSVRFGMVLGKSGGGWPLLRKVFRCGLGGRLGSGRQWMPWIHVDDVVRLLLWAVEHGQGVWNGVAPEQVTNAEFTRQLATAVHRPALFPVPAAVLKLLPGGMGSMFLDSVRAQPQAALQAGFSFRFPTLAAALADLY